MRLGDMIDDHCARFKRTTDHAIVAMNGDDVVKVASRTCSRPSAMGAFRKSKTSMHNTCLNSAGLPGPPTGSHYPSPETIPQRRRS